VQKGLSVAVEVVTGLSVTVNNSNFTGACPYTFTFTGTITVNSPATATYQWYDDGVASGTEQTISFGAAGSQNVTHPWSGNSAVCRKHITRLENIPDDIYDLCLSPRIG
jgi:hypothetical protein